MARDLSEDQVESVPLIEWAGIEWIERTLEAPEFIVPDPNYPTIERCFQLTMRIRKLAALVLASSRSRGTKARQRVGRTNNQVLTRKMERQ